MLQILVTFCKRVFILISHIAVWHYCCHPERIHLNRCWHTNKLAHTCTHPLSDTTTHRAISNQSQWLLCSSLNGRPDLRYAELFPPSPNFQATRGKKVVEKLRDREHEILCKPLIHFILLPNLQSPGTTYSVMRKWVEKGSEACCENSLQHSLRLSATVSLKLSKCTLFESLPSRSFMQLQPTATLLQVEDWVLFYYW